MKFTFRSSALIACLLVASVAGAQDPTGTIEGRVTDPSSAAVRGAHVVARHRETGLTREATSADDGFFRLLAMPVGDLVSNWAYMVMASLAWSLKAWSALVLPEGGRWAAKYRAEKRSLLRMEFSTFCVALIQVPCQVVRTGRRIVYRLLTWNPWQGVFLRLVERLQSLRL